MILLSTMCHSVIRKKQVLHDVSVTLRKNTLTALVGPSGSGKSTMLKLCARFYDPQQGQVLFNGVGMMRLPKGYDTQVGEGGCTLSGGEKQRISIARAILKEPSVVLLDEATASLDPENEVEVQRAINTLITGRTVIVIAHRLKTIKNADNIIVLEEGRMPNKVSIRNYSITRGYTPNYGIYRKRHWGGSCKSKITNGTYPSVTLEDVI